MVFYSDLNLMRDGTWSLLANPPNVQDCEIVRDSEEPVFDLVGQVDPKLLSGVPLNFPGKSYEQKTCFLYSILVAFLSTSLSSEDDLLSSEDPLAAWIRLHLQRLSDSNSKGNATPLSLASTPFPFEQLISQLTNPSAAAIKPDDVLTGVSRLQAALGKEAGEQQQQQREFLCQQIIICALLCLALFIAITANVQIQSNVALSAVITVTLARLMNDFSEWSLGKVVQGAVGILGVREAPDLLAKISMLLTLAWAFRDCTSHQLLYRRMSPDEQVRVTDGWPQDWVPEAKELEREPLIRAIECSLMCLRYLAAAGARTEFGSIEGMLPCKGSKTLPGSNQKCK